MTKAAWFAGTAHTGQTRKGLPDPYVRHVERVARAAAEAGLSQDAIDAAYLHDVVEDTAVDFAALDDAGFSARTVTLVRLLTKWWTNRMPADVQRQEKMRYYATIMADDEALALKLLDRADNLRDAATIAADHRDFADTYLRKTVDEFWPLHAASRNAVAKAQFEQALAQLKHVLGEP